MEIVDALVVTLGLDPSDFTKGRKQAAAEMLKLKNEAVGNAKKIEEANRKTADGFAKMRNEALAFFAILTGSRSVKDFVANLTSANAQIGYLSANLGESPQMMQAWGKAVERMGGSSDNASTSIGNIAKAFFDLKNNGKALPDSIYRVFAMAGKPVDTAHGLDKFLNDTADALQKLAQKDRTAAFFFGKGMGLTDDMVNLMIRYGSATTAHVQALQGLAASDKAIAAAQKITEEFAKFSQQTEALGNTLYEQLGPIVADILDSMSAWVEANKEWLSTKITEAVGEFVQWVKQIDWESVKAGLSGFASEAKDVADAVNGIVSISKTLLEMWGVSKVAGIPGAIGVIAARAADATGVTNGINNNVPGAGAVDDWVYRMTGGWVGTSAAAQQWYRENPGKEFTGSVSDFNAHPEKYLKGPLPGRATGGPVQAGRAYMVGEKGPEPFIPGTSGTVLPNSFMGGNVQVDGRNVSRGNPMPVTLRDGGGQSGGKSLLEWLFGRPGSSGGAVVGASGSGGGGVALGKGAATGSWWTPARMAHAVDRLQKEAGLSKMGAAALVARWSGIEAGGGPGAVNPRSGAFGIAQWLGSRKAGIAGNTDFDAQLSHAISELNGAEKKAGDALRSAKTMGQGARGASMYERAEGYNAYSGTDNFTASTPVGKVLQMLGKLSSLELMSGAAIPGLGGLPTGAALSSVTNNHPVTTSSRSNSMHIDTLNVNAPQARDAKGVAGGIMQALADYQMAAMANTGQV